MIWKQKQLKSKKSKKSMNQNIKINEIEESSNLEIISINECNKETTNEDENTPVPIVAEMIEVVENIEVTKNSRR